MVGIKSKSKLEKAAPDMLAALKAAIAQADEIMNKHYFGKRTIACNAIYQQCVAAIEKAEGRA